MGFKKWYLRVFSRHPSHVVIRKNRKHNILFRHRACIRLGSTTEASEKWNRSPIQINTTEAIKTSSSKLRMKKAFVDFNIKSPKHWLNYSDIPSDAYPIVAKLVYGSRGRGMFKCESKTDLESLIARNKRLLTTDYYFEKFHNYTREYRLHATQEEVFYTNRKMLKSETPDRDKWYRNDSNCAWFLETNPGFDKPSNWKEICREAVMAVRAVGLDIGAIDVRVKGKKDGRSHKFVIIEINSAPSFGNQTAVEYSKIIPKLLEQKAQKLNI